MAIAGTENIPTTADKNFIELATTMLDYNLANGPGRYPINANQLGKVLGLSKAIFPIMKGERSIPEDKLILFARYLGEDHQAFWQAPFPITFDPETHDLSQYFTEKGKYIDQSGAGQANLVEGNFKGTLTGANSTNYSAGEGTMNIYQSPTHIEAMGGEELKLRLVTLTEYAKSMEKSLEQKAEDIKKIQIESKAQADRLWDRIKDLEGENKRLLDTVLDMVKKGE